MCRCCARYHATLYFPVCPGLLAGSLARWLAVPIHPLLLPAILHHCAFPSFLTIRHDFPLIPTILYH